MLSVEKPKEPCCEKCGQSLPQPPPLTVSGKIEEMRKMTNALVSIKTRALFLLLAEILDELEKRPAFNFAPLTQPPTQTVPYIPPYNPWPGQTGEPVWPNTYPRIICNTNEVSARGSESFTARGPVSDATGYVEEGWRHD